MKEISKRSGNAVLVDLSLFPRKMELGMFLDGQGNCHYTLRMPDGGVLNLADFRSVWWRRPQYFEIHSDVTNVAYRSFAYNESHEAFSGLWQSLDASWINHPTRDEVAHHKAYQLHVAQDVGLEIPRTLISNSVEQVCDFIAAQGWEKTIYKAFSATADHWRETRLLRQDELAKLEDVRYAPVIFQEYIKAVYDLRVTVVGDQIFPVAIHSQATSYKVDFRMNIVNARIEPTNLPTEIESKLLSFMNSLGLVYGAIDLRLTPKGQYVFLEINPSGQWLFIEQFTKQPITASLAELLVENVK